MASISAFMEMLEEFLNEMSKTYPEENAIVIKIKEIQELKDSEKESYFDSIKCDLEKVSSKITNKNENAFKKGKVQFFDSIKMYKLWKIEVSEDTRDAIWKYLNTLYVLSSTISALPKDLMKSIENMAQECANKLSQDNENPDQELDLSKLDIGSLMSGMQNILGNFNIDNNTNLLEKSK